MNIGKIALVLFGAGTIAAFSQVVPDWFVLELNETPTQRVRAVRSVRDAQVRTRAAITSRLGARAEVMDATEVVMNSLIVRSRAGAAELASIEGVRRVWPVYEIHSELDRAVGLLKVSKVWEAVGGAERAGVGVKIGILDTGLDLTHPGFRPDSMSAPEGYPRATSDAILGQLNGKVIVYRTYDAMLGFEESALDNAGHGTGVAMAAAGLRATGPRGQIKGVAPGAWLGVYKIFAGPNGATSNTAIAVKALDDAVADGMDVVNLSWGFLPQARPEFDPLVPALDRAGSLGISIIKSQGNSGPVRLSGSTPSLGSNGLTVGASWTDRIFASGIRLNGAEPLPAVPGDGPVPDGPIRAPIKDVGIVDPTSLACSPLPADSLSGSVALILRGDCTFETKINAAQAAGALGVVVYTHTSSPNASGMVVGSATLPAVMISNRDGVAVKAILADKVDSTVEIAFDNSLPFILDSDGISGFSSRGPGADGGIRPDLLAIGEEVLTAAQKSNRNGELYDPSGFTTADGTSFSSPMVAGAYAVLKAARPGLTGAQYRSLLVNTAQPFPVLDARPAPVQVGGAGRLDLDAAMRGRLAADPVSISFGLGGQRVDASRIVRVQNVSNNAGSWKVSVDSGDDVKVTVEPAEFSIGAAETIELRLTLQGDVQLGEYQGFVLLTPSEVSEGERPQRIAYWYGVPLGKPATATVIPSAPSSAEAGSNVSISMLITDAIGASTPYQTPNVTVLEGDGSFVEASTQDLDYPGYWLIRLRMGAATGQVNRFRVEVGPIIREVIIRTR